MASAALEALQSGPKQRSHMMHEVFKRNRTAKEINALRDLLIQQDKLQVEQSAHGELWRLP